MGDCLLENWPWSGSATRRGLRETPTFHLLTGMHPDEECMEMPHSGAWRGGVHLYFL